MPFEQHPPLHGSLIPQVVEHACVTGLHAVPVGQSLVARQPHFEPLDVPEGTHAVPDELELQSMHVPLEPHEPAVFPGSQVPPEPQQLPTHGVPPLPHVTSHTPAVHDVTPRAQSVKGLVQPHCPPIVPPLTGSQRFPVLALAQLAQMPPVLPQAVSVWPVTHVPESPPWVLQQPPLQSASALQVVPH